MKELIGSIWEEEQNLEEEQNFSSSREILIFYSPQLVCSSHNYPKFFRYENSQGQILFEISKGLRMTLNPNDNALLGYTENTNTKRRFDIKFRLVSNVNKLGKAKIGFKYFIAGDFLSYYKLLKNTTSIDTIEDINVCESMLKSLVIFLNDQAEFYYKNKQFDQALNIYDSLNVVFRYSHFLESIYRVRYPDKTVNNSHPAFQTLYESHKIAKSKVQEIRKKSSFVNLLKSSLNEEEFGAYHLREFQSEDQFKFGKYQNFYIGAVIEFDIDYIFWCICHVLSFCIAPELLTRASLRTKLNFYHVIEVNLVKCNVLKLLEDEEILADAGPIFGEDEDY